MKFQSHSKSVKAHQQIKDDFDVINFWIPAVFYFNVDFVLSRRYDWEQFFIFQADVADSDCSFVGTLVEKFCCCWIFDGVDQKVADVVGFWRSWHEGAPFDPAGTENLPEATFLEFVEAN